jgi:hypothetical protein
VAPPSAKNGGGSEPRAMSLTRRRPGLRSLRAGMHQRPHVTCHLEAGNQLRIAGLTSHRRFRDAMALIVRRKRLPFLGELVAILPLGLHASGVRDDGVVLRHGVGRLTGNSAAQLLHVQIRYLIGTSPERVARKKLDCDKDVQGTARKSAAPPQQRSTAAGRAPSRAAISLEPAQIHHEAAVLRTAARRCGAIKKNKTMCPVSCERIVKRTV